VKNLIRVFCIAMSLCLFGCTSSSEVEDAIDLAEGVDRKDINVNRLGLNAFANDNRFGSIPAQYLEVRDTLGIKRVRILFAWNNAVQSSPGADPNFSFYDKIADSIPAGVEALVVVTGLPTWMSNAANWIDSDPRKTFFELWVKKVINRYKNRSRLIAY